MSVYRMTRCSISAVSNTGVQGLSASHALAGLPRILAGTRTVKEGEKAARSQEMWTEKKAACKRAGFLTPEMLAHISLFGACHSTSQIFLLLTSCACSHACHACFFGRMCLTSHSKKNWQGEKEHVKTNRPHWEPRRVQHICDFEVMRGQTANIPHTIVLYTLLY